MPEKQELVVLNDVKKYTSWKRFSFNAPKDCEFIMAAVKAGRLKINCVNNIYTLLPSELILLPAGEVTKIHPESDPETCIYILCVSGSGIGLAFNEMRNNPRISAAPHSDLFRKLEQLLFLFESILPRDSLTALKLVWEIMGNIVFSENRFTAETVIPAHVLAIKQLFHEHPESLYSLDELAESIHINKYKLIKDFKEYFHATPMRYLLELRIDLAKEMLTATDLNVTQIAQRAGFSGANYFVHVFKDKTGVSPTEYRRSPK